MPNFFDTHSHVHFPQFDEDRGSVLARMRKKDVYTIVVGTMFDTSRGARDFAEANEGVWATIGVHPTDSTEGFEFGVYKELLSEKVVAIGECGLDYFRGERDELYPEQKDTFENQIEFAVENDLPLMLHIRPSQGSNNAHTDALEILKSYQRSHGEKVRGNTHFFTSSAEVAKQYWDIGFTTAIPGVVTFAPEMHETVRQAPIEMLLSETDAPYAAPVPHRGERNEPIFVEEVVKTIADLRGEDVEKVAPQLVKNALRVFAIDA